MEERHLIIHYRVKPGVTLVITPRVTLGVTPGVIYINMIIIIIFLFFLSYNNRKLIKPFNHYNFH